MTTFTLNSQKYDGRYMYLTLTQAKDIATNSSIINWTLTVTGGGSNYYNTGPTTIIIGDTQVYYKGSLHWSTKQFPAAKGSVSGSLTLQHNDQGELTLPIVLKTAIYTGQVETNSGEWALDTIERAATLLTAHDFNDEENPTITYTVPSPYTVESVQVCITLDGTNPDIAYREVDREASSYTFNLTDAERRVLRAAVTSGTSRALKFYLKTVINGVNYYSRSNDKIFTVADAEPVISNVEFEDVNAATAALTGNPLSIVQGYSNISAKFAVTPQKGASMVSHSVTCGSKSIDSNEGTLYGVDGDTIVYSGTDNRGLTTTWTVPMTLIRYIKLTCNLIATAPTTGGDSTLTVSGNYFNDTFGATNNALTIQYRYKANNDEYGDWITAAAASLNGNTYNIDVPVSGLNYLNKYTFQARAVDALNTIDSVERVVKTTPLFDWGENDFNFNVPVKINNIELDYIVEQGEKNGWYYKKWNSGAAECWYSATVSGINVGEFNMDGFYYCGSKGVDFPFTFKSVTYTNATGGSTGNMNIVRPFNNSNSNMTYIVMGATNTSNATVKINLEAKGKWR